MICEIMAKVSSPGHLPGFRGKAENCQIISMEEVARHDGVKDCWVVIYDRVYDVTDFLQEHPGGSDVLLEYAGRDATGAFRASGHSPVAVKSLNGYFIGELPLSERIFRKPGGYSLSDMPE